MDETIPLNTQQDDQIEKYFNWNNKIRTINRCGEVGFHRINRFEYNEVVQLLIPNNSSQLTLNHQSNLEQIQQLIFENCGENIPNDDSIKSSVNRDELIKEAKEFRLQIDLYKNSANQNHLITKLIIEIIEYYINEYLIEQERFSQEEILNISTDFRQSIVEENYLKYILKSFTLTKKFDHILTKHLVLYLNPSSYLKSQNCLIHIVTLLISHPDIEQYQFKGITYRSLLMKEEDLKCYSIGSYILNKSFVLTTKNRSIAEKNTNSNEISVLFKYTIQQNQTAIDIQHFSVVPDEEEVLIFPFSVFQVQNRIEYSSDTPSTRLVEIHFEEYQEKKRKKISKSKYLKIGIGLCIIFTLIITMTIAFIRLKFRRDHFEELVTVPNLDIQRIWEQDGITKAGGHGKGKELNQLSYPNGVDIDIDQLIYIADTGNDRIVEWKSHGSIVAGGKGKGNRMDQFNEPTNVIRDKSNDSLIICDSINRRIMRWPRRNGQYGKILISNIDCFDLMMDDDGDLYVSDIKKHQIKRWKIGETRGMVVAGGNQLGNGLHQLNHPTYIFIDQEYSIYISDSDNHRIIRWDKDAEQGIIIAGQQGYGNSSRQLYYPHGIIVDQLKNLYVADSLNHRVMRWLNGAQEGTILIGGNGKGNQSNQLDFPTDLSFDRDYHLYILDSFNHRLQIFNLHLH